MPFPERLTLTMPSTKPTVRKALPQMNKTVRTISTIALLSTLAACGSKAVAESPPTTAAPAVSAHPTVPHITAAPPTEAPTTTVPPVPATLDPAAADKAKDVVWGMSAYPHALRLSDLFTTMSEKAGAYDVVGLLDTCGEIESEAMLFGDWGSGHAPW